jgi:hypothetical protein
LTDALVDALVTLHLPKQTENARLVDLKTVRTFIEDGKITHAMYRLDAFVADVEDDVASGGLTEEDGNNLLAIAQDLVDALSP